MWHGRMRKFAIAALAIAMMDLYGIQIVYLVLHRNSM
jgi:hypothetical protein